MFSLARLLALNVFSFVTIYTNRWHLTQLLPRCSETPVIEKEVEECDAPKVAETEEATTETTTTNGSSAEEEVKENGATTETDSAPAPTTTTSEEAASEETTDAAAAEVVAAAETNGDSTGKRAFDTDCVKCV